MPGASFTVRSALIAMIGTNVDAIPDGILGPLTPVLNLIQALPIPNLTKIDTTCHGAPSCTDGNVNEIAVALAACAAFKKPCGVNKMSSCLYSATGMPARY